jgi:hypothetical protein
VATTRDRKPINPETRAEDERLREELRKADISKLKRLMKPLIVQSFVKHKPIK